MTTRVRVRCCSRRQTRRSDNRTHVLRPHRRRTKISASLAWSDRPGRVSQPNTRRTAKPVVVSWILTVSELEAIAQPDCQLDAPANGARPDQGCDAVLGTHRRKSTSTGCIYGAGLARGPDRATLEAARSDTGSGGRVGVSGLYASPPVALSCRGLPPGRSSARLGRRRWPRSGARNASALQGRRLVRVAPATRDRGRSLA